MLPSAQKYLSRGGISANAAAYITIGCFLGGVVGIQIVSRILHHYIPSHVVDCDHTHDEDEREDDHGRHDNGFITEDTPLLFPYEPDSKPDLGRRSVSGDQEMNQKSDATFLAAPSTRRPTLQPNLTTRMSTFMTGRKTSCDQGGPCYGYSDLCGRECLKTVSRSPTTAFGRLSNPGLPRHPRLLRTATAPLVRQNTAHAAIRDEESSDGGSRTTFSKRPRTGQSEASARAIFRGREGNRALASSHLSREQSSHEYTNGHQWDNSMASESDSGTANDGLHHHHVPSNAFLAIGLQTSIAIALHKLPEGFITYATNHANPKLGFAVFMALFIHNITEGFAMALPLYLAINSRWQAMLWSSLLGGVSQPLGAGVAALWFRIAGRSDMEPDDTVYGCMFSITAGIMASVALQLFSESLILTRNRNICTAFAFIGMGILGVSFALTA
ncbi:MAG: hypothetical protein Q9217_000657 [Psora testacea]